MTYTQCKLQKGSLVQISWIPSKFATLGKTLKLKPEGNGWIVIEIWQTLSEMEVNNLEKRL